MTRELWTEPEIIVLRAMYPTHSAREIAHQIGRKTSSVYAKASSLGLRTNPEAVARMARERSSRSDHGGRAHQFQPGHATWNKGVKGSTGLHPNTAANYFRAGQLNGRARHLVDPLGTLRINSDGVLERKVTEISGPAHRRWHPISRLVWEAAHGPVPAGHIVVFKPGMRTTVLAEITLDRLDLITRAERMRRNSLHNNYPPQLAKVVQLRGALTRQINRKAKEQQRS